MVFTNSSRTVLCFLRKCYPVMVFQIVAHHANTDWYSKNETTFAATCGEGMQQPGARGTTWQQPEGVGPAISWETLRVGSTSGKNYWVRVVFAESTTEGTGLVTDEDCRPISWDQFIHQGLSGYHRLNVSSYLTKTFR